jgi:hypothetical protein
MELPMQGMSVDGQRSSNGWIDKIVENRVMERWDLRLASWKGAKRSKRAGISVIETYSK